LLVVLMIMGLFVGLVSVVVRPDDRGMLRVEAERLARLLELAVMESRMTGKAIALTADGPGYRFWRRNGEAVWTEMRDSDLLRARALPPGMAITGLKIENTPAAGAMRVEFEPYGGSPSFRIDMRLGEAAYAVSSSPVGEVRVTPADAQGETTADARARG